jgi:acyl carrier protein
MSKLDGLLADIFGDDATSLGDDTRFADLVDWDSLKHVELIVGIETRFGVQLESAEIARLTSRAAALDVLAAKGCDV